MNELIERWVAGDPDAADEIYRTYYRRVKGFVVRLGENINDAEDIAQEALVAGLEGIQAGKRPDRFTRWLMGIARNRRARRPRLPAQEPPDAAAGTSGSATLAARREMGRVLDETLRDLPAHDRDVLDLRHRSNLTRKEIAARLDLPIETVHARFERAYARLRQRLSRHFTTLAVRGVEREPVTLESIRALRPAFRDAVTACHLENRSEAEAALHLGVPAATLRARLESAYELLHCEGGKDFREARKSLRAATASGSSPCPPAASHGRRGMP